MGRRRRSPGKKGDRAHPSAAFVAELQERAQHVEDAELELWIRDVRPAVRQIGRAELVKRGLRPEMDTLAI